MQMVKRIIGGFFIFLILLWLFAPKQELYYFLEKSLKEKNIIISNENITDTWYGLKLTNADIYVSGAKMAKVDTLTLNIFFFYNTLKVENVNISPNNINILNVKHSILDPLNVKIDGEGSFGELTGNVALRKRKVEILLPVTKDITTIKQFLRKDNIKGWYYETNY